MTQPPETAPSSPRRVSHVQISFDLPEGVCLQFTVEALPADGQAEAGEAGDSRLPVEIVVRPLGASKALPAGAGRVQAVITPAEVSPAALVSVEAQACPQDAPAPGGAASLQETVTLSPARATPARRIRLPGAAPASLGKWIEALRERSAALAAALFGLSLAVYLAVRLIGLASFPIYFFTDEAVQTVLAADLVRDGFRSYEGVFLPTYFKNGNYYNLSLSVYLQVLPTLLFGKTVFVTRAVSVLVSLLAALSVGLILRRILKASLWWSGVLLLSLSPAWFLHSRTAFETVIFVSFYAATLAGYLLYRYHSPRFLYPTLVLAALAFYSYSPGQMVMAVTAVLLFLSDLPYHWKNRATLLRGAVLLALLALPYVRFRLWNNDAPLDHLRNLGSYWMQPGSLSEKALQFAREYLRGISPAYWYIPNGVDLPRHLMKGYGHLLWWTLPFAAAGLLAALWNLASPAHRVVLIALLAAPAGSALVGTGITRTLVFVVPVAILSGLGLSKIVDWIAQPGEQVRGLRLSPLFQRLGAPNPARSSLPAWLAGWRLPQGVLASGVFAVLAAANFAMLRDALANGPTWHDDYGMGGMQWGAAQLFPTLQEYQKEHPDTRLIVSPSWANGTDVVARFFLPDGFPLEMGSIAGHMFQKLALDDSMLFVMIPEEFEQVQSSGKFADIRVERTLDTPAGRPGFYFVRLSYVDEIEAILETERAGRRTLEEGEVIIDETPVRLRYSPLDMGDIRLPFDGDPHTVARTLEANPFVFELTFPEPRPVSGVVVNIGSLEVKITARLYAEPGAEPVEFSLVYKGAVDHPEAVLEFGRWVPAKILHLEIQSVHESEPAHVHVWEVRLK